MKTWMPVPRWPDLLEASAYGQIRMKPRRLRFVDKAGQEQWRVQPARVLPMQMSNAGYLLIHFSVDGVHLAKTVHSLVAEAFLGLRPEGLDVCHLNGLRADNRAVNLKYDTRANNHRDRIQHGTIYDGAPHSKLTPSVVRVMRALHADGQLHIPAFAKACGTSQAAIRNAVRKATFKYVED